MAEPTSERLLELSRELRLMAESQSLHPGHWRAHARSAERAAAICKAAEEWEAAQEIWRTLGFDNSREAIHAAENALHAAVVGNRIDNG